MDMLDLEDVMDIVDLVFEVDPVLYQRELLQKVISYTAKVKAEYEAAVKEQPQNQQGEEILTETDYTSADCASVA